MIYAYYAYYFFPLQLSIKFGETSYNNNYIGSRIETKIGIVKASRRQSMDMICTKWFVDFVVP